MKHKLRSIVHHPKTKEALKSMKPERSVWGFVGVAVFFIFPEIVAFLYGAEITAYAKEAQLHAGTVEKYYFDFLVMMFEEGGSWINLALGGAVLVWLFF